MYMMMGKEIIYFEANTFFLRGKGRKQGDEGWGGEKDEKAAIHIYISTYLYIYLIRANNGNAS